LKSAMCEAPAKEFVLPEQDEKHGSRHAYDGNRLREARRHAA
jgi:hypothetical protein